MAKTAKNILSLNHEEAISFFMKSEQYHGFELPEYFTFDGVLKYVRETIGDTPYEECIQDGISPDELSDVNLDILRLFNKAIFDYLSSSEICNRFEPSTILKTFLVIFVRGICTEKGMKRIDALLETI